jgi:hypothetical protein
LLAALAIYAFFGQRGASTPDSSPDHARDSSQTAPATMTEVPVEAHDDAQEVAGRLESQQSLRKVRDPVTTVAGTLTIGRADQSGARQVVSLDGVAIPALRDDVITLVHRAMFSDREIVVGFTQCKGPVAPCGLPQPFWLELRAGLPPKGRRAPGLWVGAGKGAGTAVASTDGVEVDLGLWNGERRRASLTPAGNIAVTRRREPRRPLSQAECTTVIMAAESCATSRDCSSFRSSARPISATQWQRLTRLYHESTGLDAASFRALCVRSCELGLTPSNGFVRQRVCNGAPPGQWPADNPAAGL